MKSRIFWLAVCLLLPGFLFLPASSQVQKLSSYDPQVKELLSAMTLEEKIGQMTQPEQGPLLENAGDIRKYFIGSVLSGGNSDPAYGNSLEAWTNLYDRIQAEAMKTRLAIPVLYGIDAVHGHSNVLGAVMFPHNIGLGCTRDPALVEKIGRITAEEVRATGIQWTFAPCVTVPQDIRWGRTYEGFSEDPAVVRSLGEAAVHGLQGADLGYPLSILACAFPWASDSKKEYRISNVEPQKPGSVFEIHPSLFDILRFKNLLSYLWRVNTDRFRWVLFERPAAIRFQALAGILPSSLWRVPHKGNIHSIRRCR